MQHFTPAQWVLIDAATQFGLDKEIYDVRLTWAKDNLFGQTPQEDLIKQADEPELFCKALIALKDISESKPTGHVIGLDAKSSGPQILSVGLHCEIGMINTGAINSGSVPDLYTTIQSNIQGVENLSRKQVKSATVPYAYGSDEKPNVIFGDKVEEFFKAYARSVPEAAWARDALVNAWNPTALAHEFMLPDGFIAYLETRAVKEFKGTLEDYTYTYQAKINAPIEVGALGSKSLAANVTHGYDGFIVRELGARCNYNTVQVLRVIQILEKHIAEPDEDADYDDYLLSVQQIWKECGFLSVSPLSRIKWDNLNMITPEYAKALLAAAKELLEYPSFEVFTIH